MTPERQDNFLKIIAPRLRILVWAEAERAEHPAAGCNARNNEVPKQKSRRPGVALAQRPTDFRQVDAGFAFV